MRKIISEATDSPGVTDTDPGGISLSTSIHYNYLINFFPMRKIRLEDTRQPSSNWYRSRRYLSLSPQYLKYYPTVKSDRMSQTGPTPQKGWCAGPAPTGRCVPRGHNRNDNRFLTTRAEATPSSPPVRIRTDSSSRHPSLVIHTPHLREYR